MKKLILSIAMVLMLCLPVHALEYSSSSGEQTADLLVHNGPCVIASVLIITDGTNDAKLILYDNTSAAKKVMFEMTVSGPENYGGRVWTFPSIFNNAIYADITGTGASYIVEYVIPFTGTPRLKFNFAR